MRTKAGVSEPWKVICTWKVNHSSGILEVSWNPGHAVLQPYFFLMMGREKNFSLYSVKFSDGVLKIELTNDRIIREN
jgi:hypothetical protein